MGCQIDNLRSGGNEKKEKKRKRKLEEAQADVNNTITANLGEDPEIVVSNKKEKKKTKKKGKERENGVEERVTQLSEGPDEKEKQKKNKDKRKENGEFTNGDAKSKDEGVVEEKQSYGGVVVSGKHSSDLKYAQLKTFSDSGLPKDVLQCCKDFAKPSPIQSHAWPFILDGRDFVGIAQTGSGVT